jgi:hypothetical protein
MAAMFGSLFAMLAMTVPAIASADGNGGGDPGQTAPYGYIEICKAFTAGTPSYQGTFHYKISLGSRWTDDVSGSSYPIAIQAVTGGEEICTQPIAVPYAGSYAVSEELAPWFQVASITATAGDPGDVSTTDEPTGTAAVTVTPSAAPWDSSNATTVVFTNNPVTGVVEVCKQAAANSSALSGTYTFDIQALSPDINVFDAKTGAYDLPYTTTASATISADGTGCSGPVTVPAGAILTTEPGVTYVTNITATTTVDNPFHPLYNQLWGSPDLGDGTSAEYVDAGDTTDQTIVTYTDALSTVKLCKEWTGSRDWPTTVFPFSLTSSGPLGPNTVTPTAGLEAGQCEIVGTVRTGTQVNITEGVTGGTKVAGIDVDPSTDPGNDNAALIVPGSESLPNRTISVIAGPGETDVTYTDEPAIPATLKICVAPTANPGPGTVSFLVGGTQTIQVALTSTGVNCTEDNTMSFPYDSPVSIVGSGLVSPDAFTGTPSAVPSLVSVYEDGVLTPTTQPTITASTAGSATAYLSEGTVNEITFTVDPPTTPIDPPVTVLSTPVSTAAPVIAPVVAPVVTDTGSTAVLPTAGTPVTTPITTTNKVTIGISAKVRKLEKQLATTKSQIKTLERKLNNRHLSKSLRKALQRELTADRKLQTKLTRELKI